MNKIKYVIFLLIFFCIINAKCFQYKNFDKIIISLTSNHENIYYTEKVINSIIEQSIDQNLYEILLILSYNEYDNVFQLPETIQFLEKSNKIRLLFVKEYISKLKRTLITMKLYANNPILIVNNLVTFPDGWLGMFIEDHIKYPNDAISASFQYYFDKYYEISEFKEGFNGNKFGCFNHVSEIIFNFGLINIDLGGILYPKNYFKNNLYYDYNLFLKSTNNSEDFWESAFIIIEDKILRQSSKIFDFTKYLLEGFNYLEYYSNKKKILEKSRLSFIKQFPNFTKEIEKRQKKIVVSIASYPERFVYLPDLMNFIKNQNLPINKIIFSFYKRHKKYYNLNISDVNIIYNEENLKPHLKYFYTMQLYREYAIITLDDDLGYSYDTFESLFNAYVENPNIINGRRAHLMTFNNNGELKNYLSWSLQYQNIKESNFNLTLTNGAGSIFPPDILNMNKNFLPIIKETITCDDLTLKYFAVRKGIPHKWIVNNHIMGVSRRLPKSKSSALFFINMNVNDICINKLNIIINNTSLNHLCVSYKNITTGNSIYLYDIHNKNSSWNKMSFDINAYSYCPIDNNLNFSIFFNNITAQCFSKQINNKFLVKNKKIFSCEMDKVTQDLDHFSSIKSYSKDNIKIIIFNYRKYLTTIYKNFICLNSNNCYLEVLLLENSSFIDYTLKINNQYYLCSLFNNNIFNDDVFPITNKFKCSLFNYSYDLNLTSKNIISGLPSTIKVLNKFIENEIIIYKFVILRTVYYNDSGKLVFIGRFLDDLISDLYNITITLIYPNISLFCSLKAYSKFVQSKIYCNVNNINITDNDIIIENQIVQLIKGKSDLLLINKETMIKININKINVMKDIKKKLKTRKIFDIISYINMKKYIYALIYILLIIIIRKIKIYFNKSKKS